MQLEGIHHITAITGDAPRNVDFYARVLGLRMVKKTVNQDDPSVYHLFYADELGSAGADLTFFEYPGAIPGRPGPGMVHRIVTRVGSSEALDFWEERLGGEGVATERAGDSLCFADPEGMAHELVVVDRPDAPLVARHREIPPELALQGFEAVRASSMRPESTARARGGAQLHARGRLGVGGARESRGGLYVLDPLPEGRGVPGAGTVHHVAFASTYEDHEGWGERVRALGLNPTPVIDRFYFRSIYFREPGGVLIEIATLGPGFTSDEPLLSLGEHLSLPPDFEHLRERIEPVLTPLRTSGPGAPKRRERRRRIRPSLRAGQRRGHAAVAARHGRRRASADRPRAPAGARGGAAQPARTGARGRRRRALLRAPRRGRPRPRRPAPARRGTRDLVGEACAHYGRDPARVIALGYSNGANIAVELLFRHPGVLRGAALLRPMLIYRPDEPLALSGTDVLIAAGDADPYSPPQQVRSSPSCSRPAAPRSSSSARRPATVSSRATSTRSPPGSRPRAAG